MTIRTLTLAVALFAGGQTTDVYAFEPFEPALPIAPDYDYRKPDVYALNLGSEWQALQIGAQVLIAGPESSQPTTTLAAEHTSNDMPRELFYTVVKGDTLSRISRKLSISQDKLKRLNPTVKWSRLQIGQQVRIASAPLAKTGAIRGLLVSLHAGPNSGSKNLGLLKDGAKVKVLRKQYDWAKVVVIGVAEGWVPNSAVALDAAASAVAMSKPAATPKVKAVASDDAAEGEVEELLEKAFQVRGVRYRWGGTSRAGFDCSGFVSYVFARMGVQLPRTSIEQSKVGQKVVMDDLQAGDLVFFRTGRRIRINHVGIYVGNGKFIHASSGGGRVQVSALGASYYTRRFAGARRVKNFAKAKETKPELIAAAS